MEGMGAGMKLRCAAALLPVVLLLVFATLASASGLGTAGSWGPAGTLAHRARAMRVRSSGRARSSARRAASPAITAPGTIKGQVSDASSAAGLEGIEVCAWPIEVEEEELLGPECTLSGSKGKYEVNELPPGQYVVEFATPFNSTLNYVAQYFPDASSFEEGAVVTVGAGSTVKNINATMVHGGRVAGKVGASAGGAPIKGIEVCAWNTRGESFGCGETGAGGEYLVTGLADGSYRVGFRSTAGVNYITQFYSGKSTYSSADEVAVNKEVTTENINAAMVQGGEISGLVTVAATGKPLSEALVCALNASETVSACTETEPTGDYTITGLPEGDYDVGFLGGPGFEEEFYNGVFSLEEATPVHVTPGSTTAGINAALYPEAVAPRLEGEGFPTITGTIAVGSTLSCSQGSWTGTAPVTYSYQWLRDDVPISGATTTTYTIQNADVGHFVACEVEASNRVGSSWARSIGYRVPSPVQDGEISGVVTLAATGKPFSEALVCALNVSETVSVCAETEPNGEYTITGLPEGEYEVEFFAGPGFEQEFYNGVFSIEEATPVHVTPGSTATGINAAMYPEAVAPRLEGERFPTITGTIAVGSTLSCSQGSWIGTTPLTYSYQWDRDRVAIPGATGTTYTIQSADIGHFVACEVTASNRAGSSWARSIGYRVPFPVVFPTFQSPVPAATTPAPGGAVLSQKAVVPSIAVLGRLHAAGGSASVKLRCAVGPCKGSLQLTVSVTRRRRSGGHTVTRRVTITIGSGSFSFAQGATGKVSIHLTSQGRKLLADAARHPHAAKLKLAMQNAPASSRAVVVG